MHHSFLIQHNYHLKKITYKEDAKTKKRIIQEFGDEIIDALAKGKGCEIRGFGSWRIRYRKKRIGRNPKTGAKVDIPAKKTIHWKMSKDLLNMLNKN